jgi:hypothetical protein
MANKPPPPWKVTKIEAIGVGIGFVEVSLSRERANRDVIATERMALLYPADRAPRVYDEITEPAP